MNSVSAFAPANISFIFKIHEDTDPKLAGSLGVGATLDKGVTVTVAKAQKTVITYNNDQIIFPAVQFVIDKLSPETVSVTIESPFPLGSGYGMSGASALATAYALNKLFDLQKTNKELAVIAHTADVVNKSGLGDVVNQYYGGCLVKFQPSSTFVVERLPFVNCKVYCQSIRKLSTESVMTNVTIKQAINIAADNALAQIKDSFDHLTLAQLLSFARQFAVESSLLQDEKVQQVIADSEKKGNHATMIMLGNGVVSDASFPGASEYTISDNPAHLL